jgi:phosphoglycolate phosphatase
MSVVCFQRISLSGSMTASSPLRLAVFDCDGTLVDSIHSIAEAVEAACTAHGIPVPEPARVRRFVGLPLEEAIARLLPDMPASDVPRVTELYKNAFTRLRVNGRVHEPLFDGALAALDVLEADGWLLGLATGKSRRGLVNTLDRHGLMGRFVTVQTADCGPGKPHPHMLYQAIAETGVEPGATIMIGDTTYDMEMARNAGVAGVGVAWGYHEADELRAAGARRVADTFADLPPLLERLVEA